MSRREQLAGLVNELKNVDGVPSVHFKPEFIEEDVTFDDAPFVVYTLASGSRDDSFDGVVVHQIVQFDIHDKSMDGAWDVFDAMESAMESGMSLDYINLGPGPITSEFDVETRLYSISFSIILKPV